MNPDLRASLIRLAHAQPELRAYLLPVIKEAAAPDLSKEWESLLMRSNQNFEDLKEIVFRCGKIAAREPDPKRIKALLEAAKKLQEEAARNSQKAYAKVQEATRGKVSPELQKTVDFTVRALRKVLVDPKSLQTHFGIYGDSEAYAKVGVRLGGKFFGVRINHQTRNPSAPALKMDAFRYDNSTGAAPVPFDPKKVTELFLGVFKDLDEVDLSKVLTGENAPAPPAADLPAFAEMVGETLRSALRSLSNNVGRPEVERGGKEVMIDYRGLPTDGGYSMSGRDLEELEEKETKKARDVVERALRSHGSRIVKVNVGAGDKGWVSIVVNLK